MYLLSWGQSGTLVQEEQLQESIFDPDRQVIINISCTKHLFAPPVIMEIFIIYILVVHRVLMTLIILC
jgi:hypothetical protein